MTHLFDHLARTAEQYPDRPAATDLDSGASITFRELRVESEAIARTLETYGLRPYDRVGLACPNGLFYLPAAFGILRANGCLTPIPSNATADEVRTIVEEIDVDVCVAAPDADAKIPHPVVGTIESGPCRGFTIHVASTRSETRPEFAVLDPAFVRFTSGSTGTSKGVVLSHAATTARVVASDQRFELSSTDRILWVLPLAYHFAVTITAYVRAAAHVLLCPDSLPAQLCANIERHRPTILYASPVQVERLANTAGPDTLASVRLAVSTAAPIRPEVITAFEERCGRPLAQAYGIIEAGLPCINLRRDGEPITSVGRPTPGYSIALFSNDGERLDDTPGQDGEVGLKGDGLFCAYYRPWQLRHEVERDGYFLTGDIGRFDDSGCLTLIGRRKAMIFVGGMKFFPEEVEAVLDQHPAVHESRVWAEPHPKLGQVARADVVAATGEQVNAGELRKHLGARLSSYKIPMRFEAVDALPRTGSGKIKRH